MPPVEETSAIQTRLTAVPAAGRHHSRAGWLSLAVLIGGFGWPLVQLAQFGWSNGMYSHVLLVPFVSAYLAWENRRRVERRPPPARGIAATATLAGAMLLGTDLLVKRAGVVLPLVDALAFTTGAFVLGVVALVAWWFGASGLRAWRFPVAFLIFMIPMPGWLGTAIDGLLQRGSADAAYALFQLSGTPVFRDRLVFELPGISLQIAPECSGIRSTLALFMTSLVAGYLFLRSPWKRGVLALAVIPLAFIRNGFRVFTIGELCVHLGPQMIDSPLHHRGGPVFFALSLIPLFLLLYALVRSERAQGGGTFIGGTARETKPGVRLGRP